MTDDIKPSGPAPGRVVLIILGVLFALGVVCCVGGWFLGGKQAWYVTKRFLDVQSVVTTKLGQGAVCLPPAQSGEGDWVLVVGVPADFPEERFAEAMDTAWIAYCDAFAEGGFPVHRIAAGRMGSGGTIGPWSSTATPVEAIAARTGRPAPQVLDWLAKADIRTDDGSGETSVKVKIGSDSGDEPREGTR